MGLTDCKSVHHLSSSNSSTFGKDTEPSGRLAVPLQAGPQPAMLLHSSRIEHVGSCAIKEAGHGSQSATNIIPQYNCDGWLCMQEHLPDRLGSMPAPGGAPAELPLQWQQQLVLARYIAMHCCKRIPELCCAQSRIPTQICTADVLGRLPYETQLGNSTKQRQAPLRLLHSMQR